MEEIFLFATHQNNKKKIMNQQNLEKLNDH